MPKSPNDNTVVILVTHVDPGGGGGHSTFFQVGVCGPDFQSVGLVN